MKKYLQVRINKTTKTKKTKALDALFTFYVFCDILTALILLFIYIF